MFDGFGRREVLRFLHATAGITPAVIAVFGSESSSIGSLVLMGLTDARADQVLEQVCEAARILGADEGIVVNHGSRFTSAVLLDEIQRLNLDSVWDEAYEEILSFRVGRHHGASFEAPG